MIMNKNNQELLVQKIRNQYTGREHTKLDELKALDSKVKRPANIFGYTFGTMGAVVMGSGMSLVMTDIGTILVLENTRMPGIVIGVAGMALALVNYPIYKGILSSRRKKYAGEIMRISDKMIKG